MAVRGRQSADSALVATLAAGSTVQEAAKQAGVSQRTAYRRLSDPRFRRRVAEARADMLACAVGALAEASTEAAATLRRLLEADSETVRLGACRAILELGVRLRESEQLEQRIATLEAAQERQGVRRWG